MADDIDIANDQAQALHESALLRRKPEPTIKATGRCLWCSAPVIKGRRWCNSECRNDWEDENAN